MIAERISLSPSEVSLGNTAITRESRTRNDSSEVVRNTASIQAAMERFLGQQRANKDKDLFRAWIPLYLGEALPRVMQLTGQLSEQKINPLLDVFAEPNFILQIMDLGVSGDVIAAKRGFSLEELPDGSLLLSSVVHVHSVDGDTDPKVQYHGHGLGRSLLSVTDQVVALLRNTLPPDAAGRTVYYLYQDFSVQNDPEYDPFESVFLEPGQSWGDPILLQQGFLFDPREMQEQLPVSFEAIQANPDISRLKVYPGSDSKTVS